VRITWVLGFLVLGGCQTFGNETSPSLAPDSQEVGGYDGGPFGGRAVFGCTDPTAQNYNGAATTDDGSCVFAPPPPTSSTYVGPCQQTSGTFTRQVTITETCTIVSAVDVDGMCQEQLECTVAPTSTAELCALLFSGGVEGTLAAQGCAP
jgi:hypothetical protein